jgi:hypothetical protein
MIKAAAIAIVLLAAAPPTGPRVYSANTTRDLEALLPILKKYVAYVHIEVEASEGGLVGGDERDGFGIVLDANKIALLSFLATDAKKITVEGTNRKTSEAKVVLYDVDRRVAIIESKTPLKDLGLEPAPVAPKETRKLDGEVFALTTTGLEAALLTGVFVYVGDEQEYGGHSRIDLKLERGMPVFDATARFVGYSRNVAWDKDRQMLITPEMIKAARSSTSAESLNRGSREKTEKQNAKPWWSK